MTEVDLNKTKKTHDEYTGRLLRFMLRPVTSLIIKHTKFTPNHISFASIVPGILGIIFLAVGGYKYTLLGAILAFLYISLDALDGMVARAKNLKSNFGAWLDSIIGYVFVPAMMLSTAIGLRSYFALLSGALAALCFPLQFTLVYYYKSEIKKNNERIKLPISSRYDKVRYLYGSALFFPLMLLGAILDKTLYVLLFFAIFGNLFWVLLLLTQFLDLKKEKT